MTHDSYRQNISDYVLGLLEPKQIRNLERHMAGCSACRREVLSEQKLVQLVSTTIGSVTEPESRRLRALMPEFKRRRAREPRFRGWQRQLSPVLLVLLIAFGGLFAPQMFPEIGMPGLVTTAHAAASDGTNTPVVSIENPIRTPMALDEAQVEALETVDFGNPEATAAPKLMVAVPDTNPTPERPTSQKQAPTD